MDIDKVLAELAMGDFGERITAADQIADYLQALQNRLEFLEYRLGYRMEWEGQLPQKAGKCPTD